MSLQSIYLAAAIANGLATLAISILKLSRGRRGQGACARRAARTNSRSAKTRP
jgi:hypothetical protein